MFRKMFAVMVALALAPTGLLAAEIQGRVKSVDPGKNTITVTVGTQDQVLDVSKNVRVVSLVSSGGRRRASVGLQQIPGGLSNVGQGSQVTLTTQTQSGVETVTQIQSGNFMGGSTGGRRRR